jgi:hypothetical protein
MWRVNVVVTLWVDRGCLSLGYQGMQMVDQRWCTHRSQTESDTDDPRRHMARDTAVGACAYSRWAGLRHIGLRCPETQCLSMIQRAYEVYMECQNHDT